MKPLNEILRTAAPNATPKNIITYEPFLNEFMPRYGIDTALRQRHFLAQLLHESGGLRYVKEIATGSAYEGRKDLGNTQPGDGVRFRGRGLIQITGRDNYRRCSIALFGDDRLLIMPEILEQPEYAVKSACWFWMANSLSALADRDDIVAVTKRINGGTNGLEDRKRYYERMQIV